jgi:hypothetical protein
MTIAPNGFENEQMIFYAKQENRQSKNNHSKIETPLYTGTRRPASLSYDYYSDRFLNQNSEQILIFFPYVGTIIKHYSSREILFQTNAAFVHGESIRTTNTFPP